MGPALDIRFHDGDHDEWYSKIKRTKRPPGGKLELEQLQAWVEHSNILQASLATLKMSSEKLTTRNAIATAERASDALNTALHKLYAVFPIILRPSGQSAAKAQEVFALPELLENILSFLPREDILWSMIAGTAWRDCVEGSVVLKRLLGILPPTEPDHEIYIDNHRNSVNFPGFDVYWTGQYDNKRGALGDNIIKVNAVFRPANLRLGSRCRNILVAHPIVQNVRLSFRDGWSDAVEELEVETGVTIGHLIDAGCAMIDERIAYDHDNDTQPRKSEEWYDMLPFDINFVITLDEKSQIMTSWREQHEDMIRRNAGKAHRRQKRIAAGDEDYDSDVKRGRPIYKGEDHSDDDSDGPEYREIQAEERAAKARERVEEDARDKRESEREDDLLQQELGTIEKARRKHGYPPGWSEEESSSDEEYTFDI